jgi:hypothetical protein
MANEGSVVAGAEPVVVPAEGAVAGAEGQPKPEPQRPAQEPKPGQKDPAWDRERTGLQADLKKERKARQDFENKSRELESRLQSEIKRVQALAGVNPTSDEETEAEEIRQRFTKLFPGLAKLNDSQMFEKLEKLLGMSDALERTTQHYWGKHGTGVLSQIEKKIAEEVGKPLTDRQIKAIRSRYVIEAENNPEFAQRHEDDPDKVVEEFTKEWIEDWFEPARRKFTADEVARQRRVPGGRDRQLVTGPGQKPIDLKDSKAVEDVLVAGFKAKGGTFGRDR